MKRIISLVLALVMCLGILLSCGKKEEYVMETTEGKGININFVYLLTSMQKSMYADVVKQNSEGNWDTVLFPEEGITWASYLKNEVRNSVESFLVCEHLFDNVYKLELSKADQVSLEEEYNRYVSEAGSDSSLETVLSSYSTDTSSLKRYLELSYKQIRLMEHLYGGNGVEKITEDEIKQLFADEYAVVTHIYFNTATKTAASGQKISLTEEEVAEKKALAESVYNRISAGEDFFTLKGEFTEDKDEESYYPHGFFVTNDDTFPTAFTKAALDMSQGETRYVESTAGIHIMHKLPMDDSLYNSDETVYKTIQSRLLLWAFETKIEENRNVLKYAEDLPEKIDMINVQTLPAFAFS